MDCGLFPIPLERWTYPAPGYTLELQADKPEMVDDQVSDQMPRSLHLADDFWYSPDVADAFIRTDVAQLIRLIQRSTGASQTQIGTAVGLAQPKISELTTPQRPASGNRSIAVMRRIAQGLNMPRDVAAAFMLAEPPDPGRQGRPSTVSQHPRPLTDDLGDVIAIYSTRSEFAARMPPQSLFDTASDVRAAGLSLNLLCQNYPENKLLALLDRGASVRTLFLDPKGRAITNREREEGWPPGHLSSLTALNIQGLMRVRTRVNTDRTEGLQIAVYDETIRFNTILIDDQICIAQPYLPDLRGVDSPTLVIRRRADEPGLYTTFDQLFASIWKRAQPL